MALRWLLITVVAFVGTGILQAQELSLEPVLQEQQFLQSVAPGDTQCLEAIARDVTDVIIAVDSTYSMSVRCPSGLMRSGVAQWGAFDVLDYVPVGVPTSVVVLAEDASELRPLQPIDSDSRASVRRSLCELKSRGQGELKDVFDKIEHLLESKPLASPMVVLFTDGEDCHPGEAHGSAAELRRKYGSRLNFHVMGICGNHSKVSQLRSLAEAGDGSFTSVQSAKQLSAALASVRELFSGFRQAKIDCIAGAQQQLTACSARESSLLIKVQSLSAKLIESEASREQLSQQLASLSQANRDVKQERDRLEKSVSQLSNELEVKAAQLEEKNARIAKVDSELTELRHERDNLSADSERVASELVESQTQAADLVARNRELANWWWATLLMSLLTLGGLLAYFLWRLFRLSEYSSRARERLEALQRENSRNSERVEELQEKLEANIGELNLCHAKLADMESQLQASRDQFANGQLELSQTQIALARCEEKSQHCASERESLSEQVVFLGNQLDAKNENMAALDSRILELGLERERDQQTIRDIDAKRAAATSRADQLESEMQRLDRQLVECEKEKVQLTMMLANSEKGKASAEATALGAAREIAAIKDHRDPLVIPDRGNSVVYGPYGPVTPVTPTPITSDTSDGFVTPTTLDSSDATPVATTPMDASDATPMDASDATPVSTTSNPMDASDATPTMSTPTPTPTTPTTATPTTTTATPTMDASDATPVTDTGDTFPANNFMQQPSSSVPLGVLSGANQLPIDPPAEEQKCHKIKVPGFGFQPYVEICGPASLIDSAIGTIKKCALVGAGAAGIALFAGTGPGAVAAFKAAFKTCIKASLPALLPRFGELKFNFGVDKSGILNNIPILGDLIPDSPDDIPIIGDLIPDDIGDIPIIGDLIPDAGDLPVIGGLF